MIAIITSQKTYIHSEEKPTPKRKCANQLAKAKKKSIKESKPKRLNVVNYIIKIHYILIIIIIINFQ